MPGLVLFGPRRTLEHVDPREYIDRMARHHALRASDADRDRIAERLRTATAEGRLLAEELEHRLELLFRSRTYGELDELTVDLPGRPLARRSATAPAPLVQAVTIAVFIVGALALLAAAAAALAVFAGGWLIWMLVAWAMFGRRARHPNRARHTHPRRARVVGHGAARPL